MRTPLAARMNRELDLLRVSIRSRSSLGSSKGTDHIGVTDIELIIVGGERIKSFGLNLLPLSKLAVREIIFSSAAS